MSKDVIVLEFNELSPVLVERFKSRGLLPNFAKLEASAITAVTNAEAEPPHLEPWIQWVTVHTGISHQEHGVFDLSDGPNFRAPRIWDMVSTQGGKVWICGSMNVAVEDEKINGFLLPDPWASDVKAYPESYFSDYIDLVRSFVQEYTSDKMPVSAAQMMRFGQFMLRHGLSAQTISRTVKQLASETVRKVKWKRALILDLLQWDLFRSLYRKERPTLSTFFLNSTAHFQHYYWRDMAPELFTAESKGNADNQYDMAILAGYQQMDQLIGQAMELRGPETSLILCTALSQKPMVDYEDIGGKQIFKLANPTGFFDMLGFTDYQYAPVMAEQFHLFFPSEEEATKAVETLRQLQLDNGTPLMMARNEGKRVFAGCSLVGHPPAEASFVLPGTNRVLPFSQQFYPVEAVRSGMHDPAGILWISTPSRQHRAISREVSLLEIAPTILSLAGVSSTADFDLPAMPEVVEAIAESELEEKLLAPA